MHQSDQQYQKLLTEVIKKQILVLGPSIALAKARNVKDLTISEDGTVTAISGNPQELLQQLIDQFMELSDLIVKKTIEPILAGYPALLQSIQPNPAQAIHETIPSPASATTPLSAPTPSIPSPLEPTPKESEPVQSVTGS